MMTNESTISGSLEGLRTLLFHRMQCTMARPLLCSRTLLLDGPYLHLGPCADGGLAPDNAAPTEIAWTTS